MTIIAGIDPGLKGGVAFLSPDGTCETFDMPVLRLERGGKLKGDIDGHALAELFWKRHVGHVFIELVNAMPGQGTTSMFAFGKGYGIAIGVLSAVAVPMTFVSPVRWKRALQVPAAKDGARARASQLMPAAASQWPLAKHEGRAEAALIALYGARSVEAIAA